jgi:plasmid stabilization system protein ParE
MTDFVVEFTPLAEADFDAIQHYIAADNPFRAITFVEELRDSAVGFLSVTPHAGSKIGQLRYFSRRNYVVVYRVNDDLHLVQVLLVSEGHRNWRHLLDGLQ